MRITFKSLQTHLNLSLLKEPNLCFAFHTVLETAPYLSKKISQNDDKNPKTLLVFFVVYTKSLCACLLFTHTSCLKSELYFLGLILRRINVPSFITGVMF